MCWKFLTKMKICMCDVGRTQSLLIFCEPASFGRESREHSLEDISPTITPNSANIWSTLQAGGGLRDFRLKSRISDKAACHGQMSSINTPTVNCYVMLTVDHKVTVRHTHFHLLLLNFLMLTCKSKARKHKLAMFLWGFSGQCRLE